MKEVLACYLCLLLILSVAAQTPTPQPLQTSPSSPGTQDEEVLRITTELVQVDAVVTDKNDQPVDDLKLSDFEVYDNGKKQELQFMEFVSVDAGRRTEGSAASVKIAPGVDTSVSRDLTAKDLKRVVAFVIDDVTIPKEDLVRVRQMLTDFVENKMGEGDLVAIIRTIGGKGLLEQLTADKQILRRAIAQLGPVAVPAYVALTSDDSGRISAPPSPLSDATATDTINSTNTFEGPSEGTNQVPRALVALSVSNQVVDSLREIPGRKSLVLVSGGLPLFDLTRSGAIIGDITPVFQTLTDNAIRSGVVINTLDARGLQTAGAVAKFNITPAKSALGGGTFAGSDENTAGQVDTRLLGEQSLTEQLTLHSLAGQTGGVAVVNANNFSAGLDRVLQRSRAYYRLAFRPSEKFDNKFHKLEVKVRRGGTRVYTPEGYYARADRSGRVNTKEEAIIHASRSPLARRDLDVAADLQYRFMPAANQAQLDINALIDAHKVNFTHTPDGKYQTSLDVVGFVFDQLGRARADISQTLNATLDEEGYRRALAAGIPYTASTQAPPGYYQVRLVVRETATGNIGTVSRYFEVPDLSNKRLTVSSLFLYGIDPSGANKNPEPLSAARVISRKQDLRYAVVIYNPKLEGNKPQVRSRLVISQGGKVLFQEPEQLVEGQVSNGQLAKVGQLGLSKVAPGRYVLTLVVTDPLAEKGRQTIARSLDFTVVN